MGGSSSKVTVGYKYYTGMHMGLCHGPVDKLVCIRVGGKKAWIGSNTGGPLTVDKPDLFGGEKREGGVSGRIDIEMGGPTQGQNSYLENMFGSSLLPAFRGVCCAVLRQCYVGLNPYLKDWGWLLQRIHVRKNGEAQWYDIKAEIPSPQEDAVPVVVSTHVKTFYAQDAVINPYEGTSISDYPGGWNFDECPATHNEGPGDYLEIVTDPTDGVRVTVLEGAWSKHHDGVTGLMPDTVVPPCATDYSVQPWVAEVDVMFENGDIMRLYTDNYSTPAAAEVAAKADPYSMTGHSKYTLWLQDGYLWNMGKLKVQVEITRVQGETNDMNPAHIIRECLTDTNWGMGYPEEDIDDVSFMAAADILFSEGMGISMLWNQQTSIEDFVEEIIRHIDATLYVERSTGKFALKLIRGGYNVGSLLVLDKSNISRVENYTKQTIAELVNEVTVTYNSNESRQIETITVQNLALIQQQSAVIPSSVEYPGFSHSTIAAKVAARDLKALSTPLTSATIYANRHAAGLNIGDVFVWEWEEADEEGTGVTTSYVMRVTEIAFGDGVDNTVRISCAQDVFALPEVTYVEAAPTEWTDPAADPRPATPRLVTETPYYELVRRLGEVDAAAKLSGLPELGYLMVATGRQGAEINADIHVDSGSGYAEGGSLDFCPHAQLDGAIGPMDTVAPLKNEEDFDNVDRGLLAQIDGEIVVIESVLNGKAKLIRGCLDTVPAAHADGSAVIVWDGYSATDGIEYVDSDEVAVKMLTITGQGFLNITDAPVDAVQMAARASLPYAPGNVKINGEYYPESISSDAVLQISWSHRDRLQQTHAPVGFLEGDIGPETGVTYELSFFNENDELSEIVTGITETSYTWVTELSSYDPHWDNVVFAFNASGLDGETDFSDDSTIGRTIFAYGDTQISNDPGYPAARFDGNADFLAVDASSDFNFGAGDFTLDIFMRKSANNPNMSRLWNPDGDYYDGFVTSISATGMLSCFMSRNGSTWNLLSAPSIATLSNDVDYAIRFSRQGGTFKCGINGTVYTLTTSLSISALYFSSRARCLGGQPGTNRSLNGYIRAMRITKGVGRDAAVVPEFPFLQASGDVKNGKITAKLKAVRDGLSSWQGHEITVRRYGYGLNYGQKYGGTE